MGEEDVSSTRTTRLDAMIRELRLLRESAGVSYRELALRITKQREGDGSSPAAARIAHSTISDVFRLGRSRINADLVAEIVRALGGDAEESERWRKRIALAASPSGIDSAQAAPGTAATAASPLARHRPAGAGRASYATLAVLIVGGVLLNSTGKFLNPLAGDVLFLDMVGTALTAILAGPWPAVATGVLFALTELLKGEVGGALFAGTMVTSGLVWGYGVRFGMGRTLPRFLALSAVAAGATSALAVPIIVLHYGGAAGRGLDGIITTMAENGTNLWAAVGSANLTVSLTDKILTGAIAFTLARLVARHLTIRASRRDVVLLAREEYDSLVETVHLMSSPANAVALAAAQQQVEEGRAVRRGLIRS